MLDLLHTHPFYEIAAVLALAALMGTVGHTLRQPLIIVFLAVGILAGPSVSGIIQSHNQIELFAQIGIALLLFIVGLRLDLHLIRTIGPVALATGIGQIVFTSLLGFGMGRAMGMTNLTAAYVAVALTFSSTIIVVKLLSDKKEIDSLHGRIAVGFLIVQDIAAIVALVALTTFGGEAASGTFTARSAAAMGLRGVALLGGVALLMRYVVDRVLERLAQSQELLILSAIAWAVALGVCSEWLGFSKEVGAFLAGVSLASSPYRDAIGGRLATLRDFLLLFFFIDMGARLDWSTVGAQAMPAAVFSVFVLIGNPLIVLAIMGFMGYRRRTGFMAGLTVAQISEFSLILGALGVSIGHISRESMGLITLVGVATIFASTYMILYSSQLYRLLSGSLRVFERRVPHREAASDDGAVPAGADVIVLGLGSYGSRIVEQLLSRRKTVLGVDFDPRQLQLWRNRGVHVLYGDASDPELYERLPPGRTEWIVSTMRTPGTNLAVLRILQQRGYTGYIALTASDPLDIDLYRRHGAHGILCPFRDAAEEAADTLCHTPDILPKLADWPITFDEVRLRAGSVFVGQRLRDIPIRAAVGASIVAVVRGGHIHYSPDAEFTLYAGDHVVVTGRPDEMGRALEMLSEIRDRAEEPEGEMFSMTEMVVEDGSEMAGKTLAELLFRQRYQASVLGIRRGGEYRLTPGPGERLTAGDRLLVIAPAGTGLAPGRRL